MTSYASCLELEEIQQSSARAKVCHTHRAAAGFPVGRFPGKTSAGFTVSFLGVAPGAEPDLRISADGVYDISGRAEALENAMVFCPVESWLTGRRLVSLPFSDHCEPLVDGEREEDAVCAAFEQKMAREMRGTIGAISKCVRCKRFDMATGLAPHGRDLRVPSTGPEAGSRCIFGGFHKSSTQRKVRRAEREGLTYREGSTRSCSRISSGCLR